MASRRKPTLMQAWADHIASRPEPPYAGSKGVFPIDAGIALAVRVLHDFGVETTQSCEGGDGHSYPEPTVCFAGGQAEGFRALGIAMEHGLKPTELRRVWHVRDGEPTGPEWQLVFQPSPALRCNPDGNKPHRRTRHAKDKGNG